MVRMAKRKGLRKKAYSISIEPEMMDAFDRYAADLDTDRSDLVRQFIKETLERAGAWPPVKKGGK